MRKRTERPNKQLLTRMMVLMTLCGVLAFALLMGQLFQIQILNHRELEARATTQQLRATTVTASRGTIFDATGAVMAQSASVENVFIAPAGMIYHREDGAFIARELSRILDVEESMILSRMENTASHYQTIRTQVDRELADEVRAFISEHNIRSVHLEPAVRRYYPRGRTASHVLGFVGTDGTGMGYGVEGRYDSYLMGTDGRIVRLRTAQGVDMLRTSYENYYSAEPGHDVHLTIDAGMQQIVEKHLNQAARDFDLQGGGFAIAMNPQTGAILAMASVNDFNPNSHGRLSDERMEQLRQMHPNDDEAMWAAVSEELHASWRNKNIGYTYEPGSTFKLITLAIALEEGIITADSTRMFYCRGYMNVRGRTEPLNCWRRQGHGSIDLTHSMQQSCNIATVELALEIGPELFFEYLVAFGLFETTGIDLQGEMLGQIWSEESWNYFIRNGNFSSLAAASFGQTFTVTPIRLVTAISALSNGGYIVEPFVVDRIVASDGTVVSQNETVVRRQVISRETSEAVLAIMEATVADASRGTGRNAAVEGFRVGGKTGTSTDTVLEALTGEKEYIVSFIAAAPIDNPEVVILVALQSPGPNNATYVSGGQMAAPVVGRILHDILPYLGFQQRFIDGQERTNTQVPYVRHQSLEDARASLEAEGFTVRVQGTGERVLDQLPAGGAIVTTGSQVVLYLDRTHVEEQVAVPDVLGLRHDEARRILEERGLYVRRSGATATHGNVIVYAQSRPAADVVNRGTVIEITLVDVSPGASPTAAN